MGWVEVPEQPQTKFIKAKDVFAKVGDVFQGVYVSSADGQYGREYTFSTADGNLTLTAPKGLIGQIEKAVRDGAGLIAVQYTANKDVGKDSPMKVFKVKHDPSYKGAPPKNGPNVRPPERAVADTADVPF